jgi:integrase
MLLDDATGIPLFDPTDYSLTQVRGRGRAANTVAAHLAAIELLLIQARTIGIELSERIATGLLLELHEIDGLATACRLPMEELIKRFEAATSPPREPRRHPPSLESLRQRLPEASGQHVGASTASNRLRVICDYLTWMIDQRLWRLDQNSSDFKALLARRDLLREAIAARMPPSKGSPPTREGLEPGERAALLRVIEPVSPDNPWIDPRVRRRNQLVVLFLYHLGLRGGELLALRLDDLNFRDNTVRVVRRPDDPADPRPIQPTAKTRGRAVPMPEDLADLAFAYRAERRAIAGAERHPFLFVETDRGRPLSARGLANIFRDLRGADEHLSGRLSPHVLRHDWNDRFSEKVDRRGIPEPLEEKMRSHLMGWREGSGTAALYTRRHIRRKATQVSLERQIAEFGGGDHDDG